MKQNSGLSVNKIMRALHRDIGFLIIGLTIIYCFSGVVLIFRNTSFLKSKVNVETQLKSDIKAADLGAALKFKRFEILDEDADKIYFRDGVYTKSTGVAVYTTEKFPAFIEKLINLHKTSSDYAAHWFTVAFGILLVFLALSSFWMFKPNTKFFKRGMAFTGLGFVIALFMILIL